MLRGWHQLSTRIAATCGALLLLVCAALAAPDFPQLTGRVVDTAGLLDAGTEASLTEKLDALEKQTTNQVVVVTLKSLGGETIETYGFQLGRHWGIGQKDQNNGALLIVAVKERKVRIEVGYGLEGIMSDAVSKSIIDLVIVPKFRVGNFSGGIIDGADMIINVLSGNAAELEARKKRAPPKSNDYPELSHWVFFIIWGALFFGPVGFAILAPILGEKIGKGRYRWLGIETRYGYDGRGGRRSSRSGRRSSGGGFSGGGFSSGGGGGFSGGGGSSGGGGASAKPAMVMPTAGSKNSCSMRREMP